MHCVTRGASPAAPPSSIQQEAANRIGNSISMQLQSYIRQLEFILGRSNNETASQFRGVTGRMLGSMEPFNTEEAHYSEGNTAIQHESDNLTAISYINRRAGCKKELNHTMLPLWDLEAKLNLHIIGRYIPGALNI